MHRSIDKSSDAIFEWCWRDTLQPQKCEHLGEMVRALQSRLQSSPAPEGAHSLGNHSDRLADSKLGRLLSLHISSISSRVMFAVSGTMAVNRTATRLATTKTR